MNEKISVIIPLYNKEHEIKRTLDSVLSQTYQNFEIIVVDDYSDDGGPEIVKSFHDPRISFIEQDHHGVSYTRNHGVDLATSNYIAFLDADDEWMPKYLETILNLIAKYPEAGMFTTAWRIQTGEGKSRWADYKCIPNPPWEGLLPNYFKSAALGESPVNSSVVVIPKKIFIETGGFPEGYWYGEDADLFGKIALKYPVAFSWEFGTIYHEDALNRASNRTLPLDDEEPFVKTARVALMKGQVPQNFKESLNEYICLKEISRALRNVRVGHSDSAQIILKQCNTRWYYNEKIKLLLMAKLPYPLYLFARDIRRKLKKIVQ
jgi:glycosyltransferase involved in cell wall biosynthesis